MRDNCKSAISKEQIKLRRERLGLSKAAFAREAGLHPSTVTQIELGRLNAYPGQMEKIVAAFERLESEQVS